MRKMKNRKTRNIMRERVMHRKRERDLEVLRKVHNIILIQCFFYYKKKVNEEGRINNQRKDGRKKKL